MIDRLWIFAYRLCNWRALRACLIPDSYMPTSTGGLGWLDLRFTPLGAWRFVVGMKLRGEYVPNIMAMVNGVASVGHMRWVVEEGDSIAMEYFSE